MGALKKIVQYFQNEESFQGNQFVFFQEFVTQPTHSWITKNPVLLDSLLIFFQRIPAFTLERLRKKKIQFVLSNGYMSCSLVYKEGASIVLVFPDLYKALIVKNPRPAHAILAHELGHIFHEHSESEIDPIIAQYEADAFACSLGYKKELKDLLNLEKSDESNQRLLALEKIKN